MNKDGSGGRHPEAMIAYLLGVLLVLLVILAVFFEPFRNLIYACFIFCLVCAVMYKSILGWVMLHQYLYGRSSWC